jgi:hypothetical protein
MHGYYEGRIRRDAKNAEGIHSSIANFAKPHHFQRVPVS